MRKVALFQASTTGDVTEAPGSFTQQGWSGNGTECGHIINDSQAIVDATGYPFLDTDHDSILFSTNGEKVNALFPLYVARKTSSEPRKQFRGAM